MRNSEQGNLRGLPSADALKKRSVEVLGYYDILTNEDDELLFAIKHLESPEEDGYSPCLYYDGGPHAIFLKNEKLVVVCDQIHPDVRKLLGKAEEALFVELGTRLPSDTRQVFDDGDKVICEEYTALVQNHPNIEAIAEELMAPDEGIPPDEEISTIGRIIFKKVRKIVADHFGAEQRDIVFATNIADDLKLDDLDIIELTMALEEEFEIVIPDFDVERWRTVGDIVKYIDDYR